jgi:hypothetical protein
MANAPEFPQEVPMSIRLRQALDAVKQMWHVERLQILVSAGLMTEAEYQESLKQEAATGGNGSKPRRRRATLARKPPKPPAS